MDLVGRFLDDACYQPETVDRARVQVRATALYSAFTSWCASTGERAPTQRRFGEALTERQIVRKQDKHGVFYVGLGLLTGEPMNGGEPNSPMNEVGESRKALIGKQGSQGSLGSPEHLEWEARWPAGSHDA